MLPAACGQKRRGESRTFGKVAKNRGLRAETFSQENTGAGIDTFRDSMLEYNELNHVCKRRKMMQAKMMRSKLENQFSAAFIMGLLFPFAEC